MTLSPLSSLEFSVIVASSSFSFLISMLFLSCLTAVFPFPFPLHLMLFLNLTHFLDIRVFVSLCTSFLSFYCSMLSFCKSLCLDNLLHIVVAFLPLNIEIIREVREHPCCQSHLHPY